MGLFAIDAPTRALVALSRSGALFRSLDDGARFTRTQVPYGDIYFFTAHRRSGRLYAYGMSGHELYRSDDGGDHWLPQIAVNDRVSRTMAVDLSNPDVLLLGGHWADGANIRKSTNGGASFTTVHTGSSAEQPNDLAFAPSEPSRVYASIGCRFLRSDDSGDHWTQVSVDGCVGDIRVHPRDPDTVYSARRPFRSVDAGATWTPLRVEGWVPKLYEIFCPEALEEDCREWAVISSPAEAGSSSSGLVVTRVGLAPWRPAATGLPVYRGMAYGFHPTALVPTAADSATVAYWGGQIIVF
ncbi:MAG: hypothetical protein QM765_39660 [Myxococcales bacterium]